ncbi:hypothetical protein P0F65_14015 [Sphingomonas sp. I4]
MLLGTSILYRIAPMSQHLHRIEAVADQPPAVTARAPSKTLTIATAGQRNWTLLFEASDDHGVAPQADLTVTVAAGEGENISFREHHLRLQGSGDPRRRRFAATLDLAALGFAGPGDLVAQLTVRDERMPGPQIARSPSLILRRLPPPPPRASGWTARCAPPCPPICAASARSSSTPRHYCASVAVCRPNAFATAPSRSARIRRHSACATASSWAASMRCTAPNCRPAMPPPPRWAGRRTCWASSAMRMTRARPPRCSIPGPVPA